MAKVITQETFDDVVRENMQEFEMDADEAVQDAVQQFESQGVNLLNIIFDPSLYTSGENTEHPVILALQNLSITLEKDEPSESDVTKKIQEIKEECDVDLARRCMAGKNNAYGILMKALEKYKQNEAVLKEVLKCLTSLTYGQPDVLDDHGMDTCMALLESYKDSTEVLKLTVRLIRMTCIRHEENRQAFVKKRLIYKLSEILETHKREGELVKEACIALQSLTLDDDIRVPFGQAHEHAKLIVNEGNALQKILDICSEYSNKPEVLSELFATVGKLVVRDEFCKSVMDMGGLDFILAAFKDSLSNKVIAKQALSVLKALSGNDNVKVAIVNAGGIDIILAAMTKHQANSKISELGCATIASIVLRNPTHCGKVIEANGHHVIVQAMKIHNTEAAVQSQACMALRNIVARTREYCDPILELGTESLINEARRCHKSCIDVAKAALRDLGCQVDLKELWKGENQGLTHA